MLCVAEIGIQGPKKSCIFKFSENWLTTLLKSSSFVSPPNTELLIKAEELSFYPISKNLFHLQTLSSAVLIQRETFGLVLSSEL
jgi:hypothetical protein